MKQVIFISSLLLIIASCGKTRSTTSETENTVKISGGEQQILDSLGFEAQILDDIRKYTDSVITPLNTSFNIYNDSTKQIETVVKNHKGFSFKSEENKARQIVFELKDSFKKNGYLIYISATNFGYNPDEVSVIKSRDQFDILRIEETDGINYGLENKDVIKKLQEWHQRYPFEIIAAELDMVDAIFIEKPDDMKSFAKEVYEFCPDIVDQGTGTVEALEKEMSQTGMLYLWWD